MINGENSRVTASAMPKCVERGNTWLIREQEARREVLIKEQRQIREQGFWAVMWPKLVVFLGFLVVWGLFLKWLY